ncbi:MAG: SpoIIE family protein phosphatase, partial [Clostridia bacterium]|nr:SpoIIE family protein phosphatase [Clostridia bacterium]MDE7305765.1 SpoIIE family protein phosphatase [Clostridia bacterium]
MIEKYYRRIIDGVPTAVIVVDQNFKAVFTNAAFRALFPASKPKLSLGGATCCEAAASRCGGENCRGCSLYDAFDDAFCSNKPVSRRIYQKVRTEGLCREVSYSITVTPLGGGLCMGTIDDAYELEIAKELQTAKSIQQKLLPAGNWAGGKRYSYTYIPCRDIGGDLPDVYTVDGSACGMIADVSGKGISAGMLSAFVKAAYDKKEYSPAKAISNLSAKFSELNLDERNYVTVAAVRIDKDSITYSTAGHNVPILLKTDSGITRIVLNSPPVSNWFENPSYFEDVIPYKKGDILVLLTDGVT